MPGGETDMKDLFSRLFDRSLLKFLAVGVLNTLLGYAIMFTLYNLADWKSWGEAGYWASTLANYIPTSILSFCLNRRFTFQDQETGWRPAVRFAVNILVCYLLAYGIAKPLVSLLFAAADMDPALRGNLSMVAGMGLFTLFNYLGQKFFTFRHKAGS